jgi:hypothetical protein
MAGACSSGWRATPAKSSAKSSSRPRGAETARPISAIGLFTFLADSGSLACPRHAVEELPQIVRVVEPGVPLDRVIGRSRASFRSNPLAPLQVALWGHIFLVVLFITSRHILHLLLPPIGARQHNPERALPGFREVVGNAEIRRPGGRFDAPRQPCSLPPSSRGLPIMIKAIHFFAKRGADVRPRSWNPALA